MKVTSFEISKKLAEIGFKAETDKCWSKIRSSRLQDFELVTLDYQVPANCDEWTLAYDLETILDALPKEIKNIGYLHLGWRDDLSDKSQWMIGYMNDEFESYKISTIQEPLLKPNESLANTAARLLIKLYEAGLVKFKEE